MLRKGMLSPVLWLSSFSVTTKRSTLLRFDYFVTSCSGLTSWHNSTWFWVSALLCRFCYNGWAFMLLWVLLWLHSGSARQLYYISWSDLRLSGIDYSCCCNIDYHCTYCGDNYDICDADISDIQCRFAFLSAFYTVTAAMTTTLYQMLRRYCLGNTGLWFEPILTGFSRWIYLLTRDLVR